MRAVIFGASSDIGIAICKKYLAMGWYVIAVFRSPREKLFELAENNSRGIEFIQFSFVDAHGLKCHLTEHTLLYSPCDTVVNCIGIARPRRYEEIMEEDIFEHIRVNAIPNIILSQFFTPYMIQRSWGRFVYISSIGIKFSGGMENYCYSMSKLLAEFFPAVAKKTWASKNVFVNTVRAGYTDTRFHSNLKNKSASERIQKIPIQRAGQPRELAEAVFYLGSDLNTFCTCEVLTVAGGE